ncbi:hypothetical protein JCM8097_004728 [Rhodosporidiobolus ruineniae]
MEPPSSDGFEIVSGGDGLSSFARPSTRPSTSLSSARKGTAARQGSAAPAARPVALSNVIELSDGSDDEPETARRAGRRGNDSDEEELQVLAGPSRSTNTRPRNDPSSALSDELPSATAVWNTLVGGSKPSTSMGRSASMTVGTSAAAGLASAPLARAKTLTALPSSSGFSLPSGLSSSPGLPPPRPAPPAAAADPKGKGKRRLFEPSDPDAGQEVVMEETQLADDPWADILGEPSPAKKGKGKGKKAGEAEGEGAKKKKRKGLFDDDSGSEGEGGAGRKEKGKSKTPRLSPSLDPPAANPKKRPSASSAAASTSTAAVPTLSRTALKKQETADRMRLREANTLRAGDKKASTAELTVHISGTAFGGLAVDGDEEEGEEDSGEEMYAAPEASKSKKGKDKGKGKKKEKPSPWLEITALLRDRLRLYDCDVECPETPRQDLGCEGALRWTRRCDRMWSEERRMFIPLREGERITVEEDSRLVFLTAHDLSHHVASLTLSTHIATLQSRLPPHVNLFVLLFGLPSLFRDLERERQEKYRNEIRAEGDGGGGGPAVKKVKRAGIGENQPSKDELELELMRVQVKSRCMIVSVDKVPEAVDWLEQLTFDVGQKPYHR